ncbi:hypothetical protein, partial [Macellibacteroides fermentans]|uniref:hypothetical protein n=1 Tax=Macellibacteroides fermentans TaxID=879969 RepID=UPI002B3B6E37|nr:hypothetical protein [Macellibacteroides fermentans]
TSNYPVCSCVTFSMQLHTVSYPYVELAVSSCILNRSSLVQALFIVHFVILSGWKSLQLHYILIYAPPSPINWQGHIYN